MASELIQSEFRLFKSELTRKLLHVMIMFVPALAHRNIQITIILLSIGTVFYSLCEKARIAGRTGGLIAKITKIASRPSETGFVWGPVTLGLGVLSALVYFPTRAMEVAIYSLAFGDSAASLVGKFLRRSLKIKIGDKTLIGSLSCFVIVFIVSSWQLSNYWMALICSVAATFLELVCVQDADNLFIPVGTGFIASILLSSS